MTNSPEIGVSLTPTSLLVTPNGQPAQAVVTIRNTSAAVDSFQVDITGLPANWYTFTMPAVALFPKDEQQAELRIQPPQGEVLRSGDYPFTITVVSVSNTSETSQVSGTVTVKAATEFTLSELTPKKVIGRKGTFRFSLTNTGGSDLEVELEAADAASSGAYGLRSKQLAIPFGQTVESQLRVRGRRFWLVGKRKEINFTLKATAGSQVKSQAGQLVHAPVFLTWRPIRRVVLLLVVLGALGVGFNAIGGSSGVQTHATDAKHQVCDRLKVLCDSGSHSSSKANDTSGNTGGKPKYIGAFKAWHDRRPDDVGDPLDNEQIRNKVSTQKTSKGMLLYDRQSGNAFLFRNDNTVLEFSGGSTVEIR